MDDYKHFETETQPKWYAISTALTMLATSAAAAVALWFFTKMPGPTLYVLTLSLLLSGVMTLVLSKKPSVRLSFSGNRLWIRDANGQEYHLNSLRCGDLILKQNGVERKSDVGRLIVKSKGLCFYGVRKFSTLSRYIQDNFY